MDDIVGRMAARDDYFLLVGPPGTGKTSVAIRQLVSRIYASTDDRLLLVAYTHRAVDELCAALETLAADVPGLSYYRLGRRSDCAAAFHNRLFDVAVEACDRRSDLRDVVGRQRIWVGTTSRLLSEHTLLDLVGFDTIVVDEASQLLEYQIDELLTHCRRFYMVGDHRQLPAVALQQGAASLFERLHRRAAAAGDSTHVGMLCRQGRMHPDIARLANMMFYDGRLRPVPLPHQRETTSTLPRFEFVDAALPRRRGTKFNVPEAKKVAQVVARVVGAWRAEGRTPDASTIGIIVPFRHQRAAIVRAIADLDIDGLPPINIDTVERYQGSQRDVIVYSTTVSTPGQLALLSEPVEIDGAQVDRKLNVAITRARRHLFVVGNGRLLATNAIYRRLINS